VCRIKVGVGILANLHIGKWRLDQQRIAIPVGQISQVQNGGTECKVGGQFRVSKKLQQWQLERPDTGPCFSRHGKIAHTGPYIDALSERRDANRTKISIVFLARRDIGRLVIGRQVLNHPGQRLAQTIFAADVTSSRILRQILNRAVVHSMVSRISHGTGVILEHLRSRR